MTSPSVVPATPPIRRIIIHSHFYQPPREDPWLEEIPVQKGAAPWHDWNEKIERECYRAVVAARVLDGDGKVSRVMNTLTRMSFDVGPTLFEWLERAAPATYAEIIDADRRSVKLAGYGNAMAQPYHHVILPLASRRDKETEVRWGIADFVRRFGRAPEGMWLPETAVDDETLDVLAQEGILFTILAPSQVRVVPPNGAMGKYTTSNGRTIALGVYDGDLSHGVAFGRLLTNARVWQAEMLSGIDQQATPSVLAIATDGETYGHHHHFSEMALAWLLDDLERRPAVEVTNFAALMHSAPPEHEVEIVAPSSWSCAHGVERWRANCGCRIDESLPPRQEWRAPLRAALETLRVSLDAQFDLEAGALFHNPATARDAYGAAVAADPAVRSVLVDTLVKPDLSDEQKIRARELLELVRDGLRMLTSCAWFFDNITGLEPAQNLRYAARAIELAGPAGVAMEAALLPVLRTARSSEPGSVTAEDVWSSDVRPLIPPLVRLAGGVAAAAKCVPSWEAKPTPAFDISVDGEHVTLVHRGTGRAYAYDVTVASRGVGSVQAYVRVRSGEPNAPTPGGTIPVALEDFPERERDAVLDAVRVSERHRLVDSLFSPATLTSVAHGDLTLIDAAVTALLGEITGIRDDPSRARAERAGQFVDLIELLGRAVPFDAQTAFARSLAQTARDDRVPFAELASRLGFAREILDSADVPVLTSAGVSG